MKKDLSKTLLGAIVVACIIPLCVNLYYSSKRTEYRNQLQQYLDKNVLEGKSTIGAYDFYNESFHNNSIEVNNVSDFVSDELSWMLIRRVTSWGAHSFNNLGIVKNVLFSGNYKWYELNKTATMSPFLIIVKKTERGYDLIGEFILGLGLTNSYPDFLISQEEDPLNHITNLPPVHKVEVNLINDYINHLTYKVYSGTTIRNEVTKNQFGTTENLKYDMLERLAMRVACRADSSLFFRVNKYFELKPDEDIINNGTQSIIASNSKFGNDMQHLLVQTATLHYSIQENKGLLDNQCKEYTLIFLAIGELVYAIIMFFLYRKK